QTEAIKNDPITRQENGKLEKQLEAIEQEIKKAEEEISKSRQEALSLAANREPAIHPAAALSTAPKEASTTDVRRVTHLKFELTPGEQTIFNKWKEEFLKTEETLPLEPHSRIDYLKKRSAVQEKSKTVQEKLNKQTGRAIVEGKKERVPT